MAVFPNVVVSNGTGVTLDANICDVRIGSGASQDAGVNYVYDQITVTAGATYAFTVDVTRLTGSTPARLDVKWRKPDGSHLDVAFGPAAPSALNTKQTLTWSGQAPAGTGKAIVCVRYAQAPQSGEWLRTANPGFDVVNPSQPGTPGTASNEPARVALLGVGTGAASGMPFNSGINPSGRGGRLGSPDGYEHLNDVVETSRGVAFDVRTGFQYQSKSITDSGAWNDLRGMQVLDWFDPSKPAVLGMRPYPNGGTLAAAAAGTYDDHYVYIGQQIAAKRPAGTGKVVLRLMWEFNLNGGYMNDKAGFIAAWQRIVTKIRQGAGDRVKFSWCPAASTNSLATLQACYPGDAYVDVIAVDTYDAWVSSGQGFHDETTWLAQTGVGDLFTWAKGRGKLFAFDEWGGHNVNVSANHSGGDNPDFYRLVLEFCRKNADWVAYECVYSESEAGNVENNLFATNGTPVQLPNARAAYIAKVQSLVS